MLSKKQAKVVRGMIEGETKQMTTQVINTFNGTATKSYALTCSAGATSGFAAKSAVNGCQSSQDQVRIKHIELSGYYDLAPYSSAVANWPNLQPVKIRQIVVWYYKPSLPADGSGTLPDLDEVLEDDTNIESLIIRDSANAGRFRVLYDKIYDLGINVYDGATGCVTTPKNRRYTFDQKVIVNKTQHYKSPPGAYLGGHYDSSSDVGQVTRGLPVVYFLSTASGVSGTMSTDIRYRTTYVG